MRFPKVDASPFLTSNNRTPRNADVLSTSLRASPRLGGQPSPRVVTELCSAGQVRTPFDKLRASSAPTRAFTYALLLLTPASPGPVRRCHRPYELARNARS